MYDCLSSIKIRSDIILNQGNGFTYITVYFILEFVLHAGSPVTHDVRWHVLKEEETCITSNLPCSVAYVCHAVLGFRNTG